MLDYKLMCRGGKSPDACEPEDHLSERMKLKHIIGAGLALAMSCMATPIATYVGSILVPGLVHFRFPRLLSLRF
jgi:hypothetical protein